VSRRSRSPWTGPPARYTPFDEPRVVKVVTARKDLVQSVTLVGAVTSNSAQPHTSSLPMQARTGAHTRLPRHDQRHPHRTVARRDDQCPDDQGRVTIDFNRAVNSRSRSLTSAPVRPDPGQPAAIAVIAGEKSPR